MSIDPDVPVDGYIDLHCHLLPGIDDGCRDVASTLDCIRQWQAAGFSGAVCTPHMATSWFPQNTPQRIAELVPTLRERIAEANIDFHLWPGGEVRLSEHLLKWFENHGIPTLGSGRCVLVDWWGNDWPCYCDDILEFLLERNYQPILAHPERMGLEPEELDEVTRRLAHLGVWLQGNLNSISGGEDPTAERLAEDFLAANRYFVLATDTHDPFSTPSRVAGLGVVQNLFGGDSLDRLMHDAPRKILSHGRSTGESATRPTA